MTCCLSSCEILWVDDVDVLFPSFPIFFASRYEAFGSMGSGTILRDSAFRAALAPRSDCFRVNSRGNHKKIKKTLDWRKSQQSNLFLKHVETCWNMLKHVETRCAVFEHVWTIIFHGIGKAFFAWPFETLVCLCWCTKVIHLSLSMILNIVSFMAICCCLSWTADTTRVVQAKTWWVFYVHIAIIRDRKVSSTSRDWSMYWSHRWHEDHELLFESKELHLK